jgi:hypothetical protein
VRHSLLVATFPYGGSIGYKASEWLNQLFVTLKKDSRIDRLVSVSINDTPITMSRNRVMKAALDQNIDWVLMLDSDMDPDLYLGRMPGVKPFWESSWEFCLSHPGPLCIAAPYCGPPPVENVYVFKWVRLQSDHPNVDLKLEQYTREEAAFLGGIQQAAALPTGVFLIRTDCLRQPGVKPPWFDYEWGDPPFNTKKDTTEDVFFTRNLDIAGVPCFCNWDAWAGHVKYKSVGKPVLLTSDNVREQFRDALRRGPLRREEVLEVTSGGVKPGL